VSNFSSQASGRWNTNREFTRGILLHDILCGFYLPRVKFEILIHVFLAYFVMEIRQNPFLSLSYFYLPSFFFAFIHTLFLPFLIFDSLSSLFMLSCPENLACMSHLFNDTSLSPHELSLSPLHLLLADVESSELASTN
jgi:hypothetical protein